jgi:Glu-tRNA(Gln) amidotransferase subunit E-like FAD-binding protein
MIDYAKVGFKAGIEIHQQLESKEKLFSHSLNVLRSDEPEYIIERRLHAIAGESGEVDIAAKYQAGLGKKYVYEGFDTISLVELDEEPPYPLNEEALKIVLQISLLLNCTPLKYSQIMRKTVIDGSNTSGFQRTVLIARDGWIDTSYGKVRVDTICLEEDSARLIKKEDDKVIFRLDRLGVPLIEIATAPDMKNPEHVKEAALKIGEILRACKVKRGIGTIRQDVNVSVKGHERVEIKGFQDPKMMIKTIDLEIERQLKDKNGKSEVRNALSSGESEFLRPMPGAARMYPETDLPLLKISKQIIDDAKKSMPKMTSELREELKSSGMNEELVKLMLQQGKVDLWKSLMEIRKDSNLIGKMIVLYPKELMQRKNLNEEDIEKTLDDEIFIRILEEINSGKLKESKVKDVLSDVLDGKDLNDALNFEELDLKEIEDFVMKLVKEKPGLQSNAYMGLVMAKFKGKIDGKTAMEIVKRFVKE